MTLKVKVSGSHFLIPAAIISGCMLCANVVILAQFCDELLRGQAEFPRILSQNGQNDLEGQGQWLAFSIPADSIRADKVKFAYVRTYVRTDGDRQRQCAVGLIGQGERSNFLFTQN